jgi:tetratricopeptide (TPR) repeat protein
MKHLRLNLDRIGWRIAVAAGAVVISAVLLVVIARQFAAGTLSDRRLMVTRDMILAPSAYLDDSARVNARLAEAELLEPDRDLARAEQSALRAVELSPYDFRNRIIYASVKEAQGDRESAEQSLDEARRLAPNNRNVEWRLANVLLRDRRLSESLPHFREALAGNTSFLPGGLDMVWRASGGEASSVLAITGDEPSAKLTLARFLVNQSRYVEAASVLKGIDRNAKLSAVETPGVINALVAARQYSTARELWLSVTSGEQNNKVIWNGGFEYDIRRNFAQFDWSLSRSDYARASIDASSAHGGSRSIKIELAGRDTTVLDNEVRQLILVHPGARYRVEYWVRVKALVSSEAPRIVVSDAGTGSWLGASDPFPSGDSDWSRMRFEFEAPPETGGPGVAVYISVKRKPRFSYDDPTTGTIWLDDFSITRD